VAAKKATKWRHGIGVAGDGVVAACINQSSAATGGNALIRHGSSGGMARHKRSKRRLMAATPA